MATFVGELQLVTTFSGQELLVGLSDLNWARIGSYVKFKNPPGPPTTTSGQPLVWKTTGIRIGPTGVTLQGGPDTYAFTFNDTSPVVLELVRF